MSDINIDEEERQRFILEISRKMDALREDFLSGEPDWDPLHAVLPMEHCDGFMWMYRTELESEIIEHYKHGITRRYLHLDHSGHAYLHREGRYIETLVGIAVEIVFADLTSMGATRETAYNEAYVLEKHRKAREAGWTVIS
ncbi:MAG: hypothetical protein ACNYZH_10400 [Acidimicrobiia bacterium]